LATVIIIVIVTFLLPLGFLKECMEKQFACKLLLSLKGLSLIIIPFSCICYSFPQVSFLSLLLCDLDEWREWDIFERFKFSFYGVEQWSIFIEQMYQIC